MPQNRETRRLTHNKQNSTDFKKGNPLRSEGDNNDTTIRSTATGISMFFKALGSWFKVFNNKNHLVPDKANIYDIGSQDKPFRSGYFSDNSIYIGNHKANRIKLGVTGTGESVKLKVRTPSGKVVADENESLQTVDGDIDLSDTSITSYAIDTSVVESGNTLTVGSGVEFSIIELSPTIPEITDRRGNPITSVADIENSILSYDSDITTIQNNINSVNSDFAILDGRTADIVEQISYGGTILNAITSLQSVYENLRTQLINEHGFDDTSNTTNISGH